MILCGYISITITIRAMGGVGAWTHDGKLRHASFKGMCGVAGHAEVFDLEGLKAGN
jgi:hypothetical protein